MKILPLLEERSTSWAIGDRVSYATPRNRKEQTDGKYALLMVNIEELFANTIDNQRLDVNHEFGGKHGIKKRVPNAHSYWDEGNHMNPSIVGWVPHAKMLGFEDGRHRLVAAYQRGEREAPVLVPRAEVEYVKKLIRAREL